MRLDRRYGKLNPEDSSNESPQNVLRSGQE